MPTQGGDDVRQYTTDCRDPECDHTVEWTHPGGEFTRNTGGVRVRCSSCRRTNWIAFDAQVPEVLA